MTFAVHGALTFWQALRRPGAAHVFKIYVGMGDTLTGVFMSLDNVLALFMLPLMGALSTVPPRAGAGARRIHRGGCASRRRRSRPSLPWQTAMHNLPLFGS